MYKEAHTIQRSCDFESNNIWAAGIITHYTEWYLAYWLAMVSKKDDADRLSRDCCYRPFYLGYDIQPRVLLYS
ncbi:hypothetical protein Psyaliredsea_15570 [Psychrobacter alimentarius]